MFYFSIFYLFLAAVLISGLSSSSIPDLFFVYSSPYAPVPPFAVIGGHDSDGTPIYVGRSFHEGDNLPAKVIPSKGCAYVCWGGQEHAKTHYEILVGQGYGWVPCYGGMKSLETTYAIKIYGGNLNFRCCTTKRCAQWSDTHR